MKLKMPFLYFMIFMVLGIQASEKIQATENIQSTEKIQTTDIIYTTKIDKYSFEKGDQVVLEAIKDSKYFNPDYPYDIPPVQKTMVVYDQVEDGIRVFEYGTTKLYFIPDEFHSDVKLLKSLFKIGETVRIKSNNEWYYGVVVKEETDYDSKLMVKKLGSDNASTWEDVKSLNFFLVGDTVKMKNRLSEWYYGRVTKTDSELKVKPFGHNDASVWEEVKSLQEFHKGQCVRVFDHEEKKWNYGVIRGMSPTTVKQFKDQGEHPKKNENIRSYYQDFDIGDWVQVKQETSNSKNWKFGMITQLNPIKVRLYGWNISLKYDYIVPMPTFYPYSLFDINEVVEVESRGKWYQGTITSIDPDSHLPFIKGPNLIAREIPWYQIRKLEPFIVGEKVDFKRCNCWCEATISCVYPVLKYEYRVLYFWSAENTDISIIRRHPPRYREGDLVNMMKYNALNSQPYIPAKFLDFMAPRCIESDMYCTGEVIGFTNGMPCVRKVYLHTEGVKLFNSDDGLVDNDGFYFDRPLEEKKPQQPPQKWYEELLKSDPTTYHEIFAFLKKSKYSKQDGYTHAKIPADLENVLTKDRADMLYNIYMRDKKYTVGEIVELKKWNKDFTRVEEYGKGEVMNLEPLKIKKIEPENPVYPWKEIRSTNALRIIKDFKNDNFEQFTTKDRLIVRKIIEKNNGKLALEVNTEKFTWKKPRLIQEPYFKNFMNLREHLEAKLKETHNLDKLNPSIQFIILEYLNVPKYFTDRNLEPLKVFPMFYATFINFKQYNPNILNVAKYPFMVQKHPYIFYSTEWPREYTDFQTKQIKEGILDQQTNIMILADGKKFQLPKIMNPYTPCLSPYYEDLFPKPFFAWEIQQSQDLITYIRGKGIVTCIWKMKLSRNNREMEVKFKLIKILDNQKDLRMDSVSYQFTGTEEVQSAEFKKEDNTVTFYFNVKDTVHITENGTDIIEIKLVYPDLQY